MKQSLEFLRERITDKMPLEDMVAIFEDLCREPVSYTHLDVYKRQIVGLALCSLRFDYVEGCKYSPVGFLEGIIVNEEYRLKDIAKNLCTKCEEWAKNKGCKEFASDCTLTNTDSIRFHLNIGFQEANRIIHFKKKL